jgi:hypothetical protein
MLVGGGFKTDLPDSILGIHASGANLDLIILMTW